MKQHRKHIWKRGLVSFLAAMLVLNLCAPAVMTRAEELSGQDPASQTPAAAGQGTIPMTWEDLGKLLEQGIAAAKTTPDDTANTGSSEETSQEVTTLEGGSEETPVSGASEKITEGATEASALEQMTAYYDQAVAAGPDAENSVYAEIYNGAMAVYTAAGSPSAADDPELYNAMGMVVMTLQGYGYDPYAVQDLAGHGGEHGGESGGNELNPTKYNSSSYVFYDTMTPTYNTDGSVKSGSVNTGDRAKISSVVLNSHTIPQGNSNSTSWSTTGSPQLSTIFPNASKSDSSSDTSTMQSGTLVITPAPGYYVAAVVVACTSRTSVSNATVTGSNPYQCNTWAEGNAFTDTFEIGTGGAATVNLSSLDFSHGSEADAYFVLISVLPVPEPLFVEYDYGIIGEKFGTDALSNSAFNHVDEWTDDSANNVYGTGGLVLTNDTQFKYAYNDSSEAANWKHYANTITAEALTDAAEVGYYFTGWRVEYFTSCSESEATSAADNENNYTLTFPADKAYGTAAAAPGAEVPMSTHCRIIAQWAPIPMTVTKDVNGLPEGAGAHTYEIAVKKDGEAFGTVTVSVTGNGETTATVKDSSGNVIPVTPGTYTVDETQPAELVINDVRYYVNVDESATVTVTANASSTGYNLKVTNTYGDTANDIPDTTFVQVQKTFTGITAVPEGFYITIGEVKYYATDAVQTTGENGEIILTWTIAGAAAGSYTVTESNYQVEDFTHTATGFGSNITVTQAVMTALETGDVQTCANLTINLDAEIQFVVVKSGNDFIIWTEKHLSANQRTAIVTAIKNAGIQSSIKEANCVFFSADAISPENGGLTYGGSTMTYDPSKKTLAFNETCAWSNLSYGTYSIETDTSEIVLENNYTPNNTSLTVSKTVAGNMLSHSQPFTFHMTITKDGNSYEIPSADLPAGVQYQNGTYIFSLKHEGTVTFEDLIPIGANITITEQTVDGLTFDTYINNETLPDEDRTHVITNIQDATTVTYKNEYDAVVDTGIHTDTYATYVMMSAMIVLAGFLMLGKARYTGKF